MAKSNENNKATGTNPIFDTVINFTGNYSQQPTKITLPYLIEENFRQHFDESADFPKRLITPYQLERVKKRIEYLFKEAKRAKDWQIGDKPLFGMPHGELGYGLRLYEMSVDFTKESGRWGSRIKRFEVIEPLKNPTEVSLSTSVKLEDKIQNREISMNIVTEDLAFADLNEFILYHPLIQQILGRKVNDIVKFTFQERRFDYKILSITEYNPKE